MELGKSERSKLVESICKNHGKSEETPSIFHEHMKFPTFLLMLGAFFARSYFGGSC